MSEINAIAALTAGCAVSTGILTVEHLLVGPVGQPAVAMHITARYAMGTVALIIGTLTTNLLLADDASKWLPFMSFCINACVGGAAVIFAYWLRGVLDARDGQTRRASLAARAALRISSQAARRNDDATREAGEPDYRRN